MSQSMISRAVFRSGGIVSPALAVAWTERAFLPLMFLTTHVPRFFELNLWQRRRWKSSVPSRLPVAAPSFVPV